MAEGISNHDYQALVAYGFSAAKALEIALDCSRGDKYALAFLDLALALKDLTNVE